VKVRIPVSRPSFVKSLVLLGAAAATLLVVAGPASAHVEVDPPTVSPGTFTTYTFTVPNETDDQDTVGVDVTIPDGFVVEDAAAVPGWRTVVRTRSNGVVSSVRWLGGSIGPHTFGEFSVRGRAPGSAGTLVFPVVQRYDASVVSWTGDSASQTPAPTVAVRARPAAGRGNEEAAGQRSTLAPSSVPAAPPTASTASSGDAEDPLARSRADLALVLVVAVIIGGAGYVVLSVLRRRTRNP